MRRSFKGAAAVAALCAGALSVTSLAVAEVQNPIKGSGSDAWDLRVAGSDRVQTALEALNEHEGKVNIMVVGYNGIVDALSLPPLVRHWGDSAIVYSTTKGLDARTLAAIKKADVNEVFISGGFGAVPGNVYGQLMKLGISAEKITRLAGADRYETAYLTAALAKNPEAVKAALQNLNHIERVKAAFASIKADYMKAVADFAKAGAALAKAAAEEAAASKAFADEAAKVADTNDQDYIKDWRAAVEANADAQAKYQELNSLRPVMVKVLEAAKKWKPLTWKDTTLGEIKAGLPELAKDIDAIVAASDKNTESTLAGHAEANLDEDTAAADAERQKANDKLAEASANFMKATQNIKQLGDPNSAVSKARVRMIKAQKALKAAQAAAKKAMKNLEAAEKAYREAADLLLGGIAEGKARAALAVAADAAFQGGRFNIFLATGMNYADALSAGPAAVHMDGVVLLTKGTAMSAQVAKAVSYTHEDVFGVGGPAYKSFKDALPVFGADRYETSAKVALRFFNAEKGVYGLASGELGADAVTAGVYLGSAMLYAGQDDAVNWDARGILLTKKASLPASVADFIQYGNHGKNQKPARGLVVFGGEGAIERGVVAEAKALSHN